MNIDKKKFFADLDEDIGKHAKKNDKKKMKNKKLDKDDPFGYGFDPDDFKKKKKKDKDKKKGSSDNKFKDKKKKDKTKKIKPESDKLKVELGDSKFSKKILKQIKSKELQESFKKDKVLIDTKKFWTKD